jgi:hypothetical protein
MCLYALPIVLGWEELRKLLIRAWPGGMVSRLTEF